MYFLNIFIVCCLIFQALSKPAQVLEDYDKYAKPTILDEHEAYIVEANEENYGDSYGSDSENYLQSEQKTLPKQDKHVSNTNDEIESTQPEKDYLENSNDDQADSEHFPRNMFSTNNDVKRTADLNRQNSMYFKNNENSFKIQNNEFNKEEANLNPVKQGRYLRHSNRMRTADSDTDDSDIKIIQNKQDNLYRDRRQINIKSDSNESLATIEITTQANEDEETAIKRHVKKLSKEELDDLVKSLSEDKRALLKNIIGGSQLDSEVLHKREITKKAGANEENNFVGNEQSDTSKVQGGSANIESDTSMSGGEDKEKFEDTKTSDGETYPSRSVTNSSEKSTEKIGVPDGAEEIKLTKLQECKENLPVAYTKNEAANSEQEPLKTANKREVNENSELVNNDDLYCSENEDISQLWNEESKLFDGNEINKREISADNLNSMKSLEDSFPNSDDANSYKLGSNMAPLIRVKRKNVDKVVEKRDINLISNLKVPYFSNTVEDVEEDNDEGSEFDDNGFFDRRSNIDKAGEISRRNTDSSTNNDYNFKSCSHNQPNKPNNLKKDVVSLGSDTDTVLSGIEGVDDNIMYNGVSRNRRTLSDSNAEENINKQRNDPKLMSENEDNEIIEKSNNAPRYQESDAFGSLPRNYEEDLGRYKRIRRLKTLPTEKDTNVAS